MADSTVKKVKNYVKGGAKEHTFSNGDSVINLDIKIEGKILGSKGDILPNDAGYAKIVVKALPSPDQYGNTHSVTENEWKPEKGATGSKLASAPASQFKGKAAFNSDTDLPF